MAAGLQAHYVLRRGDRPGLLLACSVPDSSADCLDVERTIVLLGRVHVYSLSRFVP